jgi:hypothetical protein
VSSKIAARGVCRSAAFANSRKDAVQLNFPDASELDAVLLPVNHARTPQVTSKRTDVREGKAVVINESAELFETRSERRAAVLEDDLVAVLGARVERLVERHRATQRAVSELRDALAARDRRIVELDAKLASGERARVELVQRIDRLLADLENLMQADDESASADPRER